MPTATLPQLRPFPVSCLGCGHVRVVRRASTTNLDVPSCPACGYVGWREARRAPRPHHVDRSLPRQLPLGHLVAVL